MRFPKKDQKGTIIYNSKITITNIPANAYEYVGYSGDTDPPCPVMLTPHKDYGSENLND
jgi:hypothetical protein